MKSKTLNILARIDTIFLITCLAVMGTVLFAQVVTRYLFQSPLIWSEEAARYLHVWIALFGIHYGFRNSAHIRVTFFYDRMPARVKSVVALLSNLIILITLIVYLPGSIIFIQDQALIVSSAMGVNMGLVYFPSFFGPLVAMLYFLFQTVKSAIYLIKGIPADSSATETTTAAISSKGDNTL